MTAETTIRMLLAGAHAADAREWRAKAARAAWARETAAALRAAQDKVTAAWDRILAALPDDLDDEALEALPEPPEQAELDALHAQIRAVIDEDRWPKHLYRSL